MAGKNQPGLAARVRRFRGRRIGVLGDFMLDRFIRGSVTRISPEAPVPLVRVERGGEDVRLGGAGNVAANLAALGARAVAIGVVGADDTGRSLRRELKKEKGVTDALLTLRNRVTTLKTRIIARHHHVVRVDWEDTEPLSLRDQAKLLQAVRRALPRLEALVLSDYNKGVFSDELLEDVLAAAHRARVPVFLDLKVERRLDQGLTLLQINQQRAEELMGKAIRTESDFHLIGESLMARFPCEILVLTLGSEGMRVFERDGQESLAATRAKPWEVFDVTGAGDTVLSVLALAVACGARPGDAAALANLAAGVVVGKLGTARCSQEELLQELRAGSSRKR